MALKNEAAHTIAVPQLALDRPVRADSEGWGQGAWESFAWNLPVVADRPCTTDELRDFPNTRRRPSGWTDPPGEVANPAPAHVGPVLPRSRHTQLHLCLKLVSLVIELQRDEVPNVNPIEFQPLPYELSMATRTLISLEVHRAAASYLTA